VIDPICHKCDFVLAICFCGNCTALSAVTTVTFLGAKSLHRRLLTTFFEGAGLDVLDALRFLFGVSITEAGREARAGEAPCDSDEALGGISRCCSRPELCPMLTLDRIDCAVRGVSDSLSGVGAGNAPDIMGGEDANSLCTGGRQFSHLQYQRFHHLHFFLPTMWSSFS
jgi:hypothetical protein